MIEDDAEPHDGLPEADRERVARLAIGAGLRHAAIANVFATATLGGGDQWEDLTASDALAVFQAKVGQVKSGDLSPAVAILMAQAMSLDAVFTEMVRRASVNMGEHPQAFERYMRLAMKAQGNSRATLEALAKIGRGGEQIVRHIHVDNRGGQAVIAETVSTGGANLIPGRPDAISIEQPHALSGSTALRGEDALRGMLPELADVERAVPDARGHVAGSAAREHERAEARGTIGGDHRAGDGARS